MDLNHYFLILNGFIISHSPKLLELVNKFNEENSHFYEKDILNYMTVYSNLQNNNSYEKIVNIDGYLNRLTIQKIFFTY